MIEIIAYIALFIVLATAGTGLALLIGWFWWTLFYSLRNVWRGREWWVE